MVPAFFHDVTDDIGSHLNHPFMCSAPKNSYLSLRTYSDNPAELVEALVGLTSINHVQNFHYNS